MSIPISFTGRGVEVTDSMKNFITEKLEKVPHIELATQANVEVGQTMAHKGTENDFYVRILLNLPRAILRMKKEGSEVYDLVDQMLPSLHQKMVQYKENFRKWEGAETWPETQVTEDIKEEESNSAMYAGYTPNVRRKVLTEMAPMSVTEAIERLELLDKQFFVFKDVQSGNIAVVSKKGANYEMIVAD